MPLNQQFVAKEIAIKDGTMTQQFECATGFIRQFSILVGCICNAIDPNSTIAIILFLIRISDESNINLIPIRIDIHNRIRSDCNWYVIDQMISVSLVFDIFNEMTFMMDTMIKTLSLPSFLRTLYFIFDGIILLSYKLITIECFVGNNNYETIVMNNFCTICGAAIVVAGCLTAIYPVMSGINGSSLNMILSIELDASIIAFAKLILYSTACLMVDAIYFDAHSDTM